MSAVCWEFDISRKTGYKIFQRYQDCGLDGLTDRSRRPYRHANRLPMQIATDQQRQAEQDEEQAERQHRPALEVRRFAL